MLIRSVEIARSSFPSSSSSSSSRDRGNWALLMISAASFIIFHPRTLKRTELNWQIVRTRPTGINIFTGLLLLLLRNSITSGDETRPVGIVSHIVSKEVERTKKHGGMSSFISCRSPRSFKKQFKKLSRSDRAARKTGPGPGTRTGATSFMYLFIISNWWKKVGDMCAKCASQSFNGPESSSHPIPYDSSSASQSVVFQVAEAKGYLLFDKKRRRRRRRRRRKPPPREK